jgi:predicted transcriptional regulator
VTIFGVMHESAVVLSLRPRFAHAIVRGQKTVELRRSFSERWIGSGAVLYATSPVRAVVGITTIERVERLDVGTIVRRFSGPAAVTPGEARAYLKGRPDAWVVHLGSVRAFDVPPALSLLRERSGSACRAPQSYAAVRPGSAWAEALRVATRARAA